MDIIARFGLYMQFFAASAGKDRRKGHAAKRREPSQLHTGGAKGTQSGCDAG